MQTWWPTQAMQTVNAARMLSSFPMQVPFQTPHPTSWRPSLIDRMNTDLKRKVNDCILEYYVLCPRLEITSCMNGQTSGTFPQRMNQDRRIASTASRTYSRRQVHNAWVAPKSNPYSQRRYRWVECEGGIGKQMYKKYERRGHLLLYWPGGNGGICCMPPPLGGGGGGRN